MTLVTLWKNASYISCDERLVKMLHTCSVSVYQPYTLKNLSDGTASEPSAMP